MICDWITKNEERCTRDAKETFSLCPQHLESQKKLQQQAFQNAKYLECSGLTQLEKVTEEINAPEGALVIFNKDPKLAYKWGRDKNTCIARNFALGYRFVEGATPQSGSRPIAGQTENSVKNFGMTLENQVGKDGKIRVGDSVLMAMPKSRKLERNRRSAEESRNRTRQIISGKSCQSEIDRIPGAQHEVYRVEGYLGNPSASPPPARGKSFVAVSTQLT